MSVTQDRRKGQLHLPRQVLFIWAITILFVNQIFFEIRHVWASSLEILMSDLCAISIFQYMAWYVIFRLIGSTDRGFAASRRDVLVIVAFCVLLFLPTTRSIWIAAAGIAIYLGICGGGDGKLRSAGIVLGALSVQEFWGHVVFNLAAVPLLRAETAVVATLLDILRPGTIWQHNVITGPNGFGIIVYEGCSSFHNLSLAGLCWLTVCKFRNQNWCPRHFIIVLAIALTVILMNFARLCLMGWNINLYRFWHDGIGAEIFGISASITILLISLYGSRSSSEPI